MRPNRLRQAISENRLIAGMVVFTANPAVVEIIGWSGFDFIFLDCEHTPLTIDERFENLMRAADVAGFVGHCRTVVETVVEPLKGQSSA